jgi:hypothetical protein
MGGTAWTATSETYVPHSAPSWASLQLRVLRPAFPYRGTGSVELG